MHSLAIVKASVLLTFGYYVYNR